MSDPLASPTSAVWGLKYFFRWLLVGFGYGSERERSVFA